MRYEILGPLRVSGARGQSFLSAPKTEVLLAALLIGAGRVATKDQLINELWRENPPRRATPALHVYVCQLRKLLTAVGGRADTITTRIPGYLLRVEDGELDLHDFQRAAGSGRAHHRAGRFAEAVVDLEQALGVYRGPVLDGVGEGPIVGGFATWAEQERLDCEETLIDAYIALGRHREILSRLSRLTAHYPLHEAFYRQLMLVLYRSERQAEALQVYQLARGVLHSQLGLEPCRSLRNMHQAILVSDRVLDEPVAS